MTWRAPLCVLVTGMLLVFTNGFTIDGTLGALTASDGAHGVVTSGHWGAPTPAPTPRPCELKSDDPGPGYPGDGTRVVLPACGQVLGAPVSPSLVGPASVPTPPARPAPRSEGPPPWPASSATPSATPR
ncbi:MAG: hypothetical protein U0360_05160 [Dehalococcoidia bacterium]